MLRRRRMTVDATVAAVEAAPRAPRSVVPILGVTQILAWGSSYYLLAVLAQPIVLDTGWPLEWVVGGLSLGLLAAGLVSPRVGDRIQRHGGRPVLAAGALCLALGLAGLGLSPSLPVYVLSWVLVGLGMGAGLYDAAFGTLGRLYGARARGPIATLTLFGGFASTACWPLSALLVSEVGWRGACLVYAGIQLLVALPLYLFALPKESPRDSDRAPRRGEARDPTAPAGVRFLLVAAVCALTSMLAAFFSVHLLTLLQAKGIALAAAVALGALVGPAQVGARLVEVMIGRFHHPVWTMIGSALGIVVGVGLLWSGLPLAAAALVCYGAGIGVGSIARGTVPLAVFGEKRYAAIMGRIALPSLIGQATAPLLGAVLIERAGADATLAVAFGMALVTLLLAALLPGLVVRRRG